jgi:hypothetical protein
MNTLTRAVLAISFIAAPALSFAQSAAAPVTRAEVMADLIRLEQAGYYPSRINDTRFPEDLQAAEAKVQAMNAATTPQAQPATPMAATTAMTASTPRIDQPRDPFYSGA